MTTATPATNRGDLLDRHAEARRVRDAWANAIASIVAAGDTPQPETVDAWRKANAEEAAAWKRYDEGVR